MANELEIAWVGWGFTVIGWVLSPVFSLLWNKLFANLAAGTSTKLRELENKLMPSLKELLSEVEKRKMGGAAKAMGSESGLATLEKMENELKSARDKAEDILDLVDYYRIERKVLGLGDRSWVWVQRLLSAAGACITRIQLALQQVVCLSRGAGDPHYPNPQADAERSGEADAERSGEADTGTSRKFRECVERIGAAILQRAKGVGAALCRSGEQIPISQRPTNPPVQRSHSLNIIKALSRSSQRWLAEKYAAARVYRDWSYEMVGIKSYQKDDIIAAYSFLPVIEGWHLKNEIEGIENTVNYFKLLLPNQEEKINKNEIEGIEEEINKMQKKKKREVFGRDKEREDICNLLREGSEANGSEPYRVIGIHGIPGSGKSTLAQYVCDHEKKAQDKHFDLIMFCHVSKTFRVDKIFRDMLEQVMQHKPSDNESPKSMQKKLEETLKGKRFLLVLDDLWVNNENQKGCDILLDVLNAGKSGSKILVTAQREDAAPALGAQEQILIPDLEENDYLLLFMDHARPVRVGDDGDQYERIGLKIANKLHRSPIAAVTVGEQLKRNSRISFWKTTVNNDVLNETMGALWWSYQQLGQDIRHCFAYCSTFPKGYELKQDELVRIWIAQGFVNKRNGATEELEDVANRYFDELLTFSFLMLVQRPRIFGTEEVFKIHDLLHELAERVAGSDFHRVDLNGSPEDIPPRVRHLFIETNNGAEIAQNILELESLRTLIIKENFLYINRRQPLEVMKRKQDLENAFERLFSRLRKLRVLIFEIYLATGISLSIPESIGQMKHLRYLCLRCHYVQLVLPSTFSKLYHMQTIEVFPDWKVSCPEDMSNLINLRHISGRLFFPNVGRLTSLQTMKRFEVKKEQGYELKQLKHLNKLRGTLKIYLLGIVGSKEEALEAQLSCKKHVTDLSLSFFGYGITAEVFEGLCPPKDLANLKIQLYSSSSYPSWMLSRRHPDAPNSLKELRLDDCSRLPCIPKDSEVFIRLRKLCIRSCNWESLPENMEHLVSLQDLEIMGCHKMEVLPTLPQSLERIVITLCHNMQVLPTTLPQSLHQIIIKKCPKISKLPTLPQSLDQIILGYCHGMEVLPTLPKSLRKIEIRWCGVLSRTCKQEGHENWHKIQHIPEKRIELDLKDEATVPGTSNS